MLHGRPAGESRVRSLFTGKHPPRGQRRKTRHFCAILALWVRQRPMFTFSSVLVLVSRRICSFMHSPATLRHLDIFPPSGQAVFNSRIHGLKDFTKPETRNPFFGIIPGYWQNSKKAWVKTQTRNPKPETAFFGIIVAGTGRILLTH